MLTIFNTFSGAHLISIKLLQLPETDRRVAWIIQCFNFFFQKYGSLRCCTWYIKLARSNRIFCTASRTRLSLIENVIFLYMYLFVQLQVFVALPAHRGVLKNVAYSPESVFTSIFRHCVKQVVAVSTAYLCRISLRHKTVSTVKTS